MSGPLDLSYNLDKKPSTTKQYTKNHFVSLSLSTVKELRVLCERFEDTVSKKTKAAYFCCCCSSYFVVVVVEFLLCSVDY